MSTKVTIAMSERAQGQPSFVLYEDVLDSLGATETDAQPLYLRLVGVSVELETLAEGGATVTVALPRKLAGELGLLRLGQATAGEPAGRSAK